MKVTILGHASTLIETPGHTIVVDPVFDDVFASGSLTMVPARTIDEAAITSRLSAIVVTHCHLDHFHRPTLERLPRDIPIIIPRDRFLQRELAGLGFTTPVVLSPWESIEVGDIHLTVTPSDHDSEEFGIVFTTPSASYWHMSDSIVRPEVGHEVRQRFGRMDLVACKYQPIRTVVGHQRGLASTCLDKLEVAHGLEAACATEPKAIFPYFFGFAFHRLHRWANRHLGPFTAEEVASMLVERLRPDADVVQVTAGDIFEIEASGVRHRAQVSTDVEPVASPSKEPWEPIEVGTLLEGEWSAARFDARLRDLLSHEILPWMAAHLRRETGLFDAYARLGVVWQGFVHVAEGLRYPFAVDFRDGIEFYPDTQHPRANLFSHLSGYALEQIFEGHASAELLWMAGGYRQYEKILVLDDDGFGVPPWEDWDLFERLPEPIVFYLRKIGIGQRALATPAVPPTELRDAATV